LTIRPWRRANGKAAAAKKLLINIPRAQPARLFGLIKILGSIMAILREKTFAAGMSP
jgi:hypothetical protein